jgi:Xaa-Pro dipeptidase
MALHFTQAEFARRRAALSAEMERAEIDGMLLFAQESMYWLTGYDTFGFCFFQCLVVRADGRMALLTRSADLRQAQHTSTLEDIRIWKDGLGADPTRDLLGVVEALDLAGKRLGVEYDSYGLTAFNGKRLEATFEGKANLAEASAIIPYLRSVKSAEEIVYVRRAAELADGAHAAALEEIRPGADEGAILARQHDVIFRGGGDYPGNEFIIGSGADALLCRYKSGRRRLDWHDQITLEFAGAYRRYHAALMRTVVLGEPRPAHRIYHQVAQQALLACEAEMRPGRTAGDIFGAHARILDEHGLSRHRLNACGYSLGAKFTPSWMDWPMFYEGNPWVIEPGMVLFAHMILMDSDTATAMCLGRTSIIGATGAEPVTMPSLDLVVR